MNPYAKLVQQNFVFNNIFAQQYSNTILVRQTNDYVRTDCGLASDTFNVAIPLQDRPSDALYAEMVGYFTSRRLPMALWLWDFLPAWKQYLDTSPLPQLETNIGMYADIHAYCIDSISPPNFTVKPVNAKNDAVTFANIMALVFGLSVEADNVRLYFTNLDRAPFYNSPHTKLFVGYKKNTPVCTGSILIDKGSIGIYDIATVQNERKQGFGSAMFHYLLQYISQNYGGKPCVLQASQGGAAIYLKAGFKPVCDIFVYENRALLQ